MYGDDGIDNKQWPQAQELEQLSRGKRACTSQDSAAMLVRVRHRAVEVRILAAREAAVQIVWAWLHLLPCIVFAVAGQWRRHSSFQSWNIALSSGLRRLAALGGISSSRMSLMDSEPRSRNAWRMASTSM